jgi:hypothetical protein
MCSSRASFSRRGVDECNERRTVDSDEGVSFADDFKKARNERSFPSHDVNSPATLRGCEFANCSVPKPPPLPPLSQEVGAIHLATRRLDLGLITV